MNRYKKLHFYEHDYKLKTITVIVLKINSLPLNTLLSGCSVNTAPVFFNLRIGF